MANSADEKRAVRSRAGGGRAACGVALGVSLACASCGGKAYDDGSDAEADANGGSASSSAGRGGRDRPASNGSGADTPRPGAVSGSVTPQPGGASGGAAGMRPNASSTPLPGETTQAWVERLLKDNCAGCHAEAGSVESMIVNGWLIPGDPEASPAIRVLVQRSPPHNNLGWPSEMEIARLCEFGNVLREDCGKILSDLRRLGLR